MPTAVTNMNAHTAEGLTPVVLRPKNPIPAILQVRSRTPVRADRMAPFLNKYPDRQVAQLLREGFTEGFVILCSLTQIPLVANILRSAK